jgi:hypothetical protein
VLHLAPRERSLSGPQTEPLEIAADRALSATQLGRQFVEPTMIVAVALPVVRREIRTSQGQRSFLAACPKSL